MQDTTLQYAVFVQASALEDFLFGGAAAGKLLAGVDDSAPSIADLVKQVSSKQHTYTARCDMIQSLLHCDALRTFKSQQRAQHLVECWWLLR